MSTQEERDEIEEDLAFKQAFNANTGKAANEQTAPVVVEPVTPQPERATAEQAVAVPDKDAPQEPEPDPFASLPQAVRDLLARVPALEARLEQTTRVANMVPALQSRIDKMNQQASPESPSAPARKFAKVEALRNELPEIADALDEIANYQHREPEPTKPEPRQSPQDDSNTTSAAERTLEIARPQYADELNSSAFQLWLVRQPPAYQAQVRLTHEAGDILAALGKFDASKAQTTTQQQLTQTRASRMAAAVAPQGDGRRQRAATTPDEDEEETAFRSRLNKNLGRK